MKKLFLLLYFCTFSTLAFSQDSDFPPKPNRLVNDYADMLSAGEEEALEQKLRNYSDTTSTQIAVVLMTSIGGYDSNQYAAELGERWGIGTGNYDNGLVILVAKEERTVTIQTGYGLEEYVPDALAKRITERTLKPAFAEGRFYEGLDRATSLIIDLASGAYQGDPSMAGEEEGGPSIIFIIIIVILVLIIFSRMGGGRGGRGGRRYSRTFGGPVIIPGGFGTFSSGGGIFGGGGGGGGGFGGFGGGSFGGGGASSSW
ncbi:TPM domain-containing protein [Pontibacter cellulosilyticus]|uniref:TPM domain-containing protein n=1 Tax=Pontibacter cellulosilyticus TaxID=1720253 RepID=A0A923SJK5_9BACT|nr:TPM domain-containing protein [Pontibacter cellulosilyticus]MBC5993923.1 TPM domain-containing protein [Pontibacter cellulosilyticus]